MSIPFVDLAAQQERIRPRLEEALRKVLAHGKYILGPEVAELEERLAAFTGARHCITVASGTEALLISLMSLGIGPGDEVITTPFTFVSTAEVIALTGAKPVFVDVEPDTCNIDPQRIEAAVTTRTRAIIPVSLYGQPADMDEINAIAARKPRVTGLQSPGKSISHVPGSSHHPIAVIEDGAQSFGSLYKERRSGNLSTIGCTSFFPSKPLGCYGDGGAIFTSDDTIAQTCREVRVHGQSKRYVHTRIGVGGRMDTLQCAVLLAKLESFEWEIEQRLEIGERYNRWMDEAGIPRVRQRADRTSVFAQYTVFLEERERIQEGLKKAGIPTAVHYPIPLNEQPAYKEICGGGNTPVAADLARRVMSLPMSAYLREEDQRSIVGNLAAARRV
jgi:UDP-2-acetamido-2-deoxy-ribo-hexuluronate aminotransferase